MMIRRTKNDGVYDRFSLDIKWRSNKVLNAIIVQKTHTKSSVGQHGPPTKAKAGSGAMEE